MKPKMKRTVAKLILRLQEKELQRWQVTEALRNYPKDEKREAIQFLIDNDLIDYRHDVSGKPGRTAVLIKLNEKGRSLISEAKMVVSDGSVWNL